MIKITQFEKAENGIITG
jgi:hypothetical protein